MVAAAQEDVSATWALALVYFRGQGVPKDLGKAREWALAAQKLGHPEAERLLADIDR